jgi:hypothetical protein
MGIGAIMGRKCMRVLTKASLDSLSIGLHRLWVSHSTIPSSRHWWATAKGWTAPNSTLRGSLALRLNDLWAFITQKIENRVWGKKGWEWWEKISNNGKLMKFRLCKIGLFKFWNHGWYLFSFVQNFIKIDEKGLQINHLLIIECREPTNNNKPMSPSFAYEQKYWIEK